MMTNGDDEILVSQPTVEIYNPKTLSRNVDDIVKADLHDATLTHATSLRRVYDRTGDHLHAHDFFQLQN